MWTNLEKIIIGRKEKIWGEKELQFMTHLIYITSTYTRILKKYNEQIYNRYKSISQIFHFLIYRIVAFIYITWIDNYKS